MGQQVSTKVPQEGSRAWRASWTDFPQTRLDQPVVARHAQQMSATGGDVFQPSNHNLIEVLTEAASLLNSDHTEAIQGRFTIDGHRCDVTFDDQATSDGFALIFRVELRALGLNNVERLALIANYDMALTSDSVFALQPLDEILLLIVRPRGLITQGRTLVTYIRHYSTSLSDWLNTISH